jgi:Cu/Zn superoxide dismutase
MSVSRTTTTTAAAAALLLASVAAGPATNAAPAAVFRGDLVDLSATTADPFGDATALLVMAETGKGAVFHLRVRGVDLSAVGNEYGAHLHVGPCVEGDGAAAGPHYNASGVTPPVVNDQTEVWLDFTVAADGTGAGDALVPFVPEPGDRAVVIHAEATAPTGAAGPRLVCLPVQW